MDFYKGDIPIIDCEKEYSGSAPTVDTSAVAGIEGVPIQDVELDGPLDECIERALAYLPGVAVMVGPDGAVRFYDTADRSEDGAIGGAEAVGQRVTRAELARAEEAQRQAGSRWAR